MVRIRTEIRHGPSRAGFRDETRELAPRVRFPRERAHLGGPRLALPGPDARLGGVIDDEVKPPVPIEEPAEVGQVPQLHQRVEAEPEIDDRAKGRIEVDVQHPVRVGNVLHHRPDAAQQWISRQALEPVRRIARLEVDPADDALDQAATFAGGSQEKFRLGLGRSRLDQYRAADSDGGEVGPQIVQAEIPIDGRERRREPTVVAAGEAPDMLVRVDPHQAIPIGSGASSAMSPASRSARQKSPGIG